MSNLPCTRAESLSERDTTTLAAADSTKMVGSDSDLSSMSKTHELQKTL